MPEARIPFIPMQETGNDSLAGAPEEAINCVIDGKGLLRRRPCVKQSSLVLSTALEANPVRSLFRTESGLTLAICAEFSAGIGKLYRVTDSASFPYAGNLFMENVAEFVETEAIVVYTGEQTGPKRVDIASPFAHTSLGGSPPQDASSVAIQGSRLLLNDPDWNGRINYSAPAAGSSTAGHEQWSASVTALGRSGFFTAEAKTDALVAVRSTTNEVYAFGTETLQIYGPDASFTYQNVTTHNHGCASRLSIIEDAGKFAWMDERRRFVVTDGRSVQVISDQIKARLDDISDVSDCFGYRVFTGSFDVYVWTFPSAGVTYAWQKGIGWSQWASWDETLSNWAIMNVFSTTRSPGSNITLAGMGDGRIGEFSASSDDDFGNRVPMSVTTGFINHGTDKRKKCSCLRLVLRRGENEDGGTVTIEYRDDTGPWNSPISYDLGGFGDDTPVIQCYSLGTYRRRQWRLRFYETKSFGLASATEEFFPIG